MRLVWTLLVSMALFAAVWPLMHDFHGFWIDSLNWGLFKNRQFDYGEGPLFNQQLMLYRLIFERGNPAYRSLNIYQLGEHPPFIVGNYPPVFPLMGALFMKIFGTTFTAGRMVSTLSIFGAAIMVGLIVWQGTGQILPGILGAGILITMPDGIQSWGPYNRVDSLALFWSMLTIFLVLRYAGTRKVYWAIPFAVLTIYTRQDMVDGVFASFCFLVVRDWRRAIWVALISAAIILGAFIILQVWTHGAFYLNTVTDNVNAFSFGGSLGAWHRFISGEGAFIFPLAVAGAAAGLFGRGSVLWAIWLAGSVFVFATIGKTGAASNYYFTLEAASAACAALCVGRLRTFFRHAPFPLWPLELILPACVFVLVHGQAPAWVPARLPLLQRAEALVGSYKIADSGIAQMAGDKVSPGDIQGDQTGIVSYLQSIQGPVMGISFPYGVVPQSGHMMQWQPFEFSVIYADGTWNPTPFVDAIQDRYYAAIIFQGQPGGYIGGAASAEVAQAIQSQYHYGTNIDGYTVLLRNSPPTQAPPTVPEPVPHPLPALGHFLVQSVRRLPHTLVHALTTRLVPPKLAHFGAFYEVNILPFLNVIGVETPGVPASNGTGYDSDGNFLSTLNDFPPEGTFTVSAFGQNVPFFIPAAGSDKKSVMQWADQTVPLPPAHDGAIWLLGSGVNGNQQTTLTLRYAGAPPTTQPVALADWCLPPGADAVVAFRGAARLNAQGQTVTPACGQFAIRVPTNPTAVLTSVQFGADPNALITALTIQKAGT